MRKHKFIWVSVMVMAVVVLLWASCAPKPTPTPASATPVPSAPTPVAVAPTTAPATATPVPAVPTPKPATVAPTPAPAVKLPPVISIATAGVGTTSYIVGSAFAEVVSKYLPTKLAIEPSGATVRWMPLMKTGEIDLAIGCDPVATVDAYYGQYDWKDKGPQPALQCVIGHVQPWGLNVTDPKIKTIADLKGKKVYGYIKGMRLYSDLWTVLIREAGLKPDDVEILTFADVNEATKGIAEGRGVGVWYIPSVLGIVELDRTKPLYGVRIPKEMADKVREQLTMLGFMTWQKGDGIAKEDIPYFSLPCGITVRENLDTEVLYTLLKTIYSHFDEYKDKHPLMKQWNAEQAVSIIASPVHPGAIKYFKEKGVWKAEQEQMQQKLLAKPRG